MIKNVFLLLGGNIGDRIFYLESATRKISEEVGTIIKFSSIYETAPWGVPDQPDFLNCAIEIATQLPPQQLLDKLLAIELSLGRERHQQWYARTIDIDILFYDTQIVEQEGLTIPHPRLPLRRFGLVPLAEIAPHFVHPQLKQTVLQLLSVCTDSLEVRKLENTMKKNLNE